MVSDSRAGEDAVCGIRMEGDIVLQRVVADAGIEVGTEHLIIRVIGPIIILVLHVGVHRVIAKHEREIGEYLIGKQMVPSRGGCGILPEKPHLVLVGVSQAVIALGYMELVATEIGTEVKFVFFAEVKIEFAVQVEEIVTTSRPISCDFHEGYHQQVKVGGAPGNHKGGLVLDDGTLHHHVGGDDSDTAFHVVAVLVAVFHVDVDDRGESAAVTCRKSTFYKLNGFDGIAVEDGKEP